MKSKPTRKKASPAPIAWIESAAADEIAETLLAVDEAKAAAVVAHLLRRSGPEVRRLLDNAAEAIDRDPVSAMLGMVVSGIRGAKR